MAAVDHKQIAHDWMAAIPTDEDVLRRVCHPRYSEDWPQSGERFHSLDHLLEVHRHYPGGVPAQETRSVKGAATEWVLTPQLTPLRITGSGSFYVAEATAAYPDGDYHVLSILEFRDDLVYRATTYFAKDYEPPEWRVGKTDKI